MPAGSCVTLRCTIHTHSAPHSAPDTCDTAPHTPACVQGLDSPLHVTWCGDPRRLSSPCTHLKAHSILHHTHTHMDATTRTTPYSDSEIVQPPARPWTEWQVMSLSPLGPVGPRPASVSRVPCTRHCPGSPGHRGGTTRSRSHPDSLTRCGPIQARVRRPSIP